MAAPFAELPLKEETFVQRLFKRLPPENALRELQNQLARADRIKSVGTEAIAQISEKYRVNVPIKHRTALEALYRDAVKHALEDRHLTPAEIEDLAHLKRVLEISDASSSQIWEDLTQAVFQSETNQAVADGRLTPEERQRLADLESNLRIPSDVARRIYVSASQDRLQKSLTAAASDERLSPNEEAELDLIANSLGVEIRLDERSKNLYERLRLYWLIENGDVPPIAVDIRLQRGEACYATAPVEWYETRTVTKRYQYGGFTGRVRIAKGIYFRVGDVAVRPVREDVLKHIDTGTAYLTTKRLIFAGTRKNSTIRLNKIIDFTPFRNGVEISKDSGRPVFLKFEHELDLFALKLDRALKDANA